MKCATCGRTIQNPYYLNGKVYGYECYKMALSLKYTKLEQIKNDSYSAKCAALIEVFTNKIFKDTWNKDFQQSILKQWNEFQKLTGKQFDCIVKKLDEIESINYLLIYTEFYKDQYMETAIYSKLKYNSDLINQFKNNEMFINIVKSENSVAIKRGKKFYIVNSKDVDEEQSIYQILNNVELENLKNDEYIDIIEVIEVA